MEGQLEKSSYELQVDTYRKQGEDCKKQLKQIKQDSISASAMLKKDILEKYGDFLNRPELDPELIRELVEKVVVESKEKVHIQLAFADEVRNLQKCMAGEAL